MNKIKISFSKNNSQTCPESQFKEHYQQFIKTIQSPEHGFISALERNDLLHNTIQSFQQFCKNKKKFVHVGIGGSSLGPEMLVNALAGKKAKDIIFLNNIDPDHLSDQLDDLSIEETLFYIVSKSGSTAETMAIFSLLTQILAKQSISSDRYKEFFIFATDPNQSQLLEIANEYNIESLEIPSNIGGRFSALTPAGLLPALFAEIDVKSLIQGAKNYATYLTSTDYQENPLVQMAGTIDSLRKEMITQTVIMPYSSKLRSFSDWFVQLWAESLGKEYNREGTKVHQGLTPISSYGATDQHSQVQLFMEGPKDKCILFVSLNKFESNYHLNNNFTQPSLKKLSPYTLEQLLRAELLGTQQALDDKKRPYIHIELTQLKEEELGAIIVLFESLTVLMGIALNIDPFNQPGVEAGKKYAFQWLEKSGKI